MRARVPLIPIDDDAAAAVLDEAALRGYRHSNLYRTIGHAPQMLKGWVAWTWPLREEASVSRALRELAIMRVAQLKQAEYEWAHHWDKAVAADVRPEQLRAIANWRDSDLFDEREREILAFTDAVCLQGVVPDAVFDAIATRYKTDEVVELTLTVAQYIGAAHLLLALQVEVEPDKIAELGADVHPPAV